jgi:tetratricopeptide (TPR) repeat protein
VDPVLFTVMAAINGAGYDADLASAANSPARQQMRDYLAQKKPPSLEGLREFYLAHRKQDPARDLSQYISLALCLEIFPAADGPDFRYKYRAVDLPPDVQELDGVEKLLTRFYREAGIGQLINANRNLLDAALEPYGASATLAMQEIDGYLRIPRVTNTKGEFHVLLDLLAAPNQIHVRSYANDLFIVITNSPEPQLDYVKNAYLHFQIDPMAMRYLAEIEKKKSLIDFAQGAAALDEQYKKDFALLTVASLARAVRARLAPGPERAQMVSDAAREGFILTPYFAEALADYEKQEQSMRLYLPVMIQGIDLKKETARLDGIEFLQAPKVRSAKVAPAPAFEKSPAEKTLEEAEDVYGKKDYDKASELYSRALTETAARPLKAKAYYGLARLAALRNDPEAAVELFEKTLAEGPEPQVAAWSHVFLGRILDLNEQAAKAKTHFEAALSSPGASPAAKKAAEDGLKGVRPVRPAAKP